MAETAVNSLLQSMKQLIINCETYLIRDEKDQLKSLCEDLEILRPVLKDVEEKRYEHDTVQNLVTQIRGMASRVDLMGAKLPQLEKFRCFLMQVGKFQSGRIANKDGSIVEKIDHTKLGDVIEEIKAIVGEVMEIYDKIYPLTWATIIPSQILNDPNTTHDFEVFRKRVVFLENAVDSLLENLKQLIIKCEVYFIRNEKDQLSSLYEELEILRPALKDVEISLEIRYQHDNLQTLVTQIRGVAYGVEMVSSKLPHLEKSRCFVMHGVLDFSSKLNGVIEEIKAITVEVVEIYDKMHDSWVLQAGEPSSGSPSRAIRTIVDDEIVVGFEDDIMTIKEQLTGGKKQLEVVSIVGMPGLGKTTLARKVFNDPYIKHHFHLRAWTFVSQSHKKRELLLEILHSLIDLTNEIKGMSDENLGERLYKRLKGKRYLLVMDDIWSIGVWDDIRVYLPNDNNRSKVLFTSRLIEVALHAKPDGHPHCLQCLTEEESWELLHTKVFQNENCLPELIEIGKQITKKCEGLPLAIVVIAGFLAKNEKTKDWWKHVVGNVSSYILSDPNQCMNTLALSYNHLPHHLKQCFLYFGAFLSDHEIPVWKLMLLWIAEGFIQHIGQKRLEDIAMDYLMDLIDRSLVIVVRKRSNGGIKACRMHDLLRDFCLKKSKELNFLKHSHAHEYKPVSLPSSSNGAYNQHRLCIHSDFLKFDGISLIELYAPVTESFYHDVPNFDYISIESSAPVLRSFLCFGNSDGTLLNFNPTFMEPRASILELLSNLPESDERVRYLINIFCNRDGMTQCEKLLFQKKCGLFLHGYSFLKGSDPSLWFSLFDDRTLDLFSFFCHSMNKSLPGPWLLNFRTFKLLRVLVLWCPNVFFSHKVLQLVHLRYLAIHVDDFFALPPSISNLLNLETLILGARSSHIIIPHTVWKMVKLRHLYSKGGQYHINFRCLKVPLLMDGISFILRNLQTISNLCPCGYVQEFLSRTPNLRKLGLLGDLISTSGHLEILDLCFLSHLETLKLDNRAPFLSSDLQQVMFPANLKTLTLRSTRIKWEEMRKVGMLPNLEVLKLEINGCQGQQWETTDGGFHRLKFLKFKLLDIERWVTSSTHFPSLQHLVLENCVLLEEIPFGLGDILTLQMIEVKFCSQSAGYSARKIKSELESSGNDQLKILIDNQECSGITSSDGTESSESGLEEE